MSPLSLASGNIAQKRKEKEKRRRKKKKKKKRKERKLEKNELSPLSVASGNIAQKRPWKLATPYNPSITPDGNFMMQKQNAIAITQQSKSNL